MLKIAFTTFTLHQQRIKKIHCLFVWLLFVCILVVYLFACCLFVRICIYHCRYSLKHSLSHNELCDLLGTLQKQLLMSLITM